MNLENLKTTIEHGVGSLTAALDVCRVELVEKAMKCGNMPLQDHFADRLLPPGKKHRKNKADCQKMVDQFMAETTACAQRYSVDLTDDRCHSLPFCYLQAWMEWLFLGNS